MLKAYPALDDVESLSSEQATLFALQVVRRALVVGDAVKDVHALNAVNHVIELVQYVIDQPEKNNELSLTEAASSIAELWTAQRPTSVGFLAAAASHMALAAREFLNRRNSARSAHSAMLNARAAMIVGLREGPTSVLLWTEFKAVGGKSLAEGALAFAEPPTVDGELEFLIDPGSATVEDIRSVLSALNALHVAYGGQGLKFRVDGEELRIQVGVLA